MVKTTVYLPDELKRDLERIARERGISEAELIRESLRKTAVAQAESRWPRVGILPSRLGPGTSNLSERVDEILAEGFGRR